MLNWITTRAVDRLRAAWKDDIRRQSDPLRGDLTHLVEAVKSLEANVTHWMETLHARLNEMVERQAAVEHRAELLRHIVLRNEKHHDRLAPFPALLNSSPGLA